MVIINVRVDNYIDTVAYAFITTTHALKPHMYSTHHQTESESERSAQIQIHIHLRCRIVPYYSVPKYSWIHQLAMHDDEPRQDPFTRRIWRREHQS